MMNGKRDKVRRALQAKNDKLAAGFNRVLGKKRLFGFRGGAPTEEQIDAELAKQKKDA